MSVSVENNIFIAFARFRNVHHPSKQLRFLYERNVFPLTFPRQTNAYLIEEGWNLVVNRPTTSGRT